MLNVRIGYITYPHEDLRASGLRHYPADHHLLSWLEAKGYEFDVLTDWELHHDGHSALKDYAVVLTGTHPEYHTREMLDALQAYRDGGGRFCYLGGNGFYWKIALSKEQPGLLEIRRAEGGIRAWAAEAGEYYNQLDGEYGGLWRRNGRPPQELVGVGFTAQGAFAGSYYRIKPEARQDPRVAWMLAGIDDDKIGDFGLSAHGAAGFELDRTDKRLGTPAARRCRRRQRKPPAGDTLGACPGGIPDAYGNDGRSAAGRAHSRRHDLFRNGKRQGRSVLDGVNNLLRVAAEQWL